MSCCYINEPRGGPGEERFIEMEWQIGARYWRVEEVDTFCRVGEHITLFQQRWDEKVLGRVCYCIGKASLSAFSSPAIAHF